MSHRGGGGGGVNERTVIVGYYCAAINIRDLYFIHTFNTIGAAVHLLKALTDHLVGGSRVGSFDPY